MVELQSMARKPRIAPPPGKSQPAPADVEAFISGGKAAEDQPKPSADEDSRRWNGKGPKPGYSRFTLELPDELRKRARLCTIEQGTTVAEIIRKALEDYCRENGRPGQ